MSGAGEGGASARSALVLGACALAAIVLLGTVQRLAAERIAEGRAARLAASLAAVLPDAPFDNDPAHDRLLVDTPALGGEGARPVYRVRLGERPVGAVLSVLAPDGYSGPIELLVGVRADGRVTAARVTAHRETPGLGDRIERRRSDWVVQLDGARLADLGIAPDKSAPTLFRDDADIDSGSEPDIDPERDRESHRGNDRGVDALSGATITSRAVVGAVHRALGWFVANRDAVFTGERTFDETAATR